MRLEQILLLRSVLAMTLADTEIAAMDSKYIAVPTRIIYKIRHV